MPPKPKKQPPASQSSQKDPPTQTPSKSASSLTIRPRRPNAVQNPGLLHYAADAPRATRRTQAEMEAAREAEVKKMVVEQKERQESVQAVAALEDAQCLEDDVRATVAQVKLPPKSVYINTYLITSLVTSYCSATKTKAVKRSKQIVPTGFLDKYKTPGPTPSHTQTPNEDQEAEEDKQKDEDDSMARFGGLAEDGGDGIENSGNAVQKRAGALKLEAPIKIEETNIIPVKPTKTSMRGGHRKWMIQHLPDKKRSAFSRQVVPLGIQQIAQGEKPFQNSISRLALQKILDKVYGPGTATTNGDDVWAGLISYQISSWRAGFGTQALEHVALLINNHSTPDHELDNANDEAGLLNSTEKIADWAQSFMEVLPDKTHRSVWRDYNYDREKGKGFVMHDLIIKTFAKAYLDNLPAEDSLTASRPYAAVLLSLTAVLRAISFYKNGVFEFDSRLSKYWFSADNWDKVHEEQLQAMSNPASTSTSTHEVSKKWGDLIFTSTKYLNSLKARDDAWWKNFLDTAQEYLAEERKRNGKKPRADSSSVPASAAASDQDESLIAVSDSDTDMD
ncbi:hypothetical protein VKT23_019313 [Stygiomarasmius scandens]|uniref:Uncharacterized protein n=1 Tax=Marasmiellus scandens TaxID=2682957 RepID=A0ABR1INA8_9AGAR